MATSRYSHTIRNPQLLRARRIAVGLTQEQLAQQVGIARTYVIALEVGREPTVMEETAQRIEAALSLRAFTARKREVVAALRDEAALFSEELFDEKRLMVIPKATGGKYAGVVVTEADVAEMRRLYKSGSNLRQVAAVFGCSHQMVRDRLKAAGVVLRSNRGVKKP